MSEFQQLARRLAPILITLMDEPFWVSVLHPTPDGTDVATEPLLEFWVGHGFEGWCPENDCSAIIAVMPASVSVVGLPSAPPRRRAVHRHLHPPHVRAAHPQAQSATVLCAVSADRETYGALKFPGYSELAEGEPEGGRLLDLMLAKFGLPPGPPCPSDLDIRGQPFWHRDGSGNRRGTGT
jgi:hypothetical protein